MDGCTSGCCQQQYISWVNLFEQEDSAILYFLLTGAFGVYTIANTKTPVNNDSQYILHIQFGDRGANTHLGSRKCLSHQQEALNYLSCYEITTTNARMAQPRPITCNTILTLFNTFTVDLASDPNVAAHESERLIAYMAQYSVRLHATEKKERKKKKANC